VFDKVGYLSGEVEVLVGLVAAEHLIENEPRENIISFLIFVDLSPVWSLI
jgi:hypothetical protein